MDVGDGVERCCTIQGCAEDQWRRIPRRYEPWWGVLSASCRPLSGKPSYAARRDPLRLRKVTSALALLPFDGGHIFFNCVEAMRRRPVDRRVMERASAIGVTVLVMLFFLAAHNDLRRIIHFG